MLTEEERKWIDENDVLDRHIFGRLNEEDAARFQFLLDRDPSFREEMEFNAALIAGIRQKGRLEMKQRLQAALKEEAPNGEMHLHVSSHKPALHENMSFMLKMAAALILLVGGSIITYKLFFDKPVELQFTKKEIKNEEVPAQAVTPKEEKKQQIIPDDSKKITAKKSTPKQKMEEKPMIAATPPENLMQKHNQKFRVETFMMPKPNEVKATLIHTDSKTEQETIILFKNSTDLVAVNIKETQQEDNGKLQWFYVVYENRILNVYVDNSKYLNLFKNAKLTESAAELQLEIKDASYRINLSSVEKFKKAVLRP